MQSPRVLHLIVIGFHHKKGCQVEYCYPPVIPGQPLDHGDLPDLWKHLPSLALPDGSHNFEKDTIFFHLPSLDNPRETVFGVSCYRQMNAERLLNKGSDVTRGTVQKSVCVLSTLPLYGIIQTKLELITHAYFDERDFTKVTLLEETYKNLNVCLSEDSLWGSQVFLGLSVRDLIYHFRHKVLILFKLMLLERKVLFYKTPVQDLCSTILTLCSLFPGMLEMGLKESAAGICSKMDSPLIRETKENYLEVCFPKVDEGSEFDSTLSFNNHHKVKLTRDSSDTNGNLLANKLGSVNQNGGTRTTNSEPNLDASAKTDNPKIANGPIRASEVDTEEEELLREINDFLGGGGHEPPQQILVDAPPKPMFPGSVISSALTPSPTLKNRPPVSLNELNTTSLGHLGPLGHIGGSNDVTPGSETIAESLKKVVERYDSSATDRAVLSSLPSTSSLVTLELESYGLPLSIFTKGAVCLPYLSLPFIDLLNDVHIRSFMIGATNVLFKQKKHLFDAIIEIDEGKVEIVDLELRKQLTLTMEDLRFAENLVQHINHDAKDVFLDGTGWEGGDEWLRAQFRLYLLSLLRTAQLNDSTKEQEAFNSSFYQAWQTTHNFRVWSTGIKHYTGLHEFESKHPYQRGQISMADMKLKLTHSIDSSDKGKKINQAVSNTGKAVLQTSRAVGGAITTAKSFVSSWFSTVSSPTENEEDVGLGVGHSLPAAEDYSLGLKPMQQSTTTELN